MPEIQVTNEIHINIEHSGSEAEAIAQVIRDQVVAVITADFERRLEELRTELGNEKLYRTLKNAD